MLDDRPRPDDEPPAQAEEESALIREAARLDARRRELDQFKAVRLYYLFLCDFEAGCR